jgi:RNase adapter protein RapZ
VVVLGGPDAEEAATFFRPSHPDVRVLGPHPGDELLALDREGVRYTLVHVGAPDTVAGGSHERAHHRIGLDQAPGLADRLIPRERPLVTCLSFAFKNGLPEDAAWLVDVRFLENSYWVPGLRDLTGLDRPVVEHVLGQPAARELADRLEADLRWALPRYQRDHLVVAFGCTGGRHRSVVLAAEMARRLSDLEEMDVEFSARDLGE